MNVSDCGGISLAVSHLRSLGESGCHSACRLRTRSALSARCPLGVSPWRGVYPSGLRSRLSPPLLRRQPCCAAPGRGSRAPGQNPRVTRTRTTGGLAWVSSRSPHSQHHLLAWALPLARGEGTVAGKGLGKLSAFAREPRRPHPPAGPSAPSVSSDLRVPWGSGLAVLSPSFLYYIAAREEVHPGPDR